MTFEERREVLSSCKYVSAVVRNVGGSDSRPAIEVVKPDVMAVGSDWETKDFHFWMGITQDWLDEKGISLVYLPYTEGISTTNLRLRAIDAGKTKAYPGEPLD